MVFLSSRSEGVPGLEGVFSVYESLMVFRILCLSELRCGHGIGFAWVLGFFSGSRADGVPGLEGVLERFDGISDTMLFSCVTYT